MTTSGKMILLNGPSSAGKTSIGQALMTLFETTMFCASIDTFVHNFINWQKFVVIDPPEPELEFPGFKLRETQQDGQRALVLEPGVEARRFIYGMHAALAGFLRAGNSLIFDDVIYDRAYLRNYTEVMKGIDVLFVGIYCPLDVLELREQERGNRAVGHARGHYALVHQHGVYDLEIDSSSMSADACAQRIKSYFDAGQKWTAFDQLRARFGAEG